MADSDNKIITIGEAQELMPGCFPSASGNELKRCPTKSELIANGFSINETTRTYENNQAVVSGDVSGYDVSYSISNERIVYSSGTIINASGSNYATIKAKVTKYIGTYPQEVLENVTLTPVFNWGDSNIYVSGTSIKASNRTTYTGDERSASFKGTYATATSGLLAVYQEANRIENSNYQPKDYYVDISIQQGVHAGGGSSNVNRTAYHSAKNLYTSGSSDDFSRRDDTPVITEVSDPNNRFNYNSSTGMLEHSSMGTYSGTDSCTLRATNNTVTKDATITVTNNYSDTWNNPVISTFSYSSTIPASGGTAMPSVTATQSGTRTWGSGSSDQLQNNAFEYTYSMPSSGRWSLKSSVIGEVSATTRGNVTGDTESSPSVTVTASAYDKSGSATATASQAANASEYHKITYDLAFRSLVAVPIQGGTSEVIGYQGRMVVSSEYGRYWALLNATYKSWTTYTSGYKSTTATTDSNVTANTFSMPSSLTWASVYSSDIKMFNVDAIPRDATQNRTGGTVTARYKLNDYDLDYKDVGFTLEQFKAPTTSTTYTIQSYGASPTEISASEYGNTHLITLSGTCKYNMVRHINNRDEQIGSDWYTGNPSGTDCSAMLSGSSYSHWTLYNGSQTSSPQMNLTFNQTTKVGSVYAYAQAPNTSQDDITQGIILRMGTDSKTFYIKHKGTGNINISVSPTSGTVQNAGGSTTFTVTSNVAGWTVSTNQPSWTEVVISGGTAAIGSTRVTVSTIGSTYTGTNDRSATISVKNGSTTYATYMFTQKGYVPPAVDNIEELYKIGSTGWIVGRFQTGLIPDQYNTKAYQIVIARSDRGSDCTFNFASDGYYNLHQGPTTTVQHWSVSTKEYTGQIVNTTDFDGNPISFYGFSIGGGPGAETGEYYSGITIA